MTKRAKLRTLWIGGVFTLFFVVLISKMYLLQVVGATGLMEKAQVMWEKDKVLQPVRGSILDRNNHILAEDGPSYTVIVNPEVIHTLKQERETANGLASLLGKPESEMMDLVTKKKDDGNYYQWVEVRSEGWKIDNDKADEIMEFFKLEKPNDNRKNLYIRGIFMEESQKRYYPSNQLAAQVLGYFDKNGKAVGGLESMYNDTLSGKPGRIITEKDRMGYDLPDAKASYEPAVDGKTIQLTIDQQIQSYMETAMEKSFLQWKPKSMSAIAVNPKTMEILAMANYPNFNPAEYWESSDQPMNFNNFAVSSQYEPGSTFKLVTLAGAVEEGLFNPTEMYKSGSINILGDNLHDWNIGGWGQISYLDGLKRSSNVAFVKLGYEKLKPDKLKDYIARFGFGEKTGIDLPNEAKGLISFKYPVEYATSTYGQGITVSTIQQAAAYAAIANGGKLLKPYIVKAIKDTRTGDVLQTNQPQFVRQVVSPATAQKVTEYLEQVVSDQAIGTGKNAYIEGYRIAGKTGTAQVVVNGKYSEDTWTISFAGYAPVEDPQIMIVVVADQPDLKGDFHEGSKVTPIVFKEVMSQSLRYLGVSAKVKTDASASLEKKIKVPDLTNQLVTDAKKALTSDKIAFDTIGKGQKIMSQYPVPGTEISVSQRIYIVTEPVEGAELPDLKGKSLRDALEVCSYMKFDCQVSGEGYVVSQTVSVEGEKKLARLELKPRYETQDASVAGSSTSGNSTSGSGKPNGTGSPSPTPTPVKSATPTPTPSGKKP